MAHDTNKEKRRFIEFSNHFVDYTNGDVVIFDNVKNLKSLYPTKSMTNLMILCTGGTSRIKMTKGSTIELSKGSVLFLPHSVAIDVSDADDSFCCKVLQISDHIVQGLLRDKADIKQQLSLNTQFNITRLTDSSFEEFHCYFTLIQSKTERSEQKTPFEIVQGVLRALLLNLCFLLQDNYDMAPHQKLSQGKILFNRFLNLVAASEVKRKPITFYASLLAITPKYLTMLCLKHSDKTASQWVIQYTTEDIRFFLRNSNLSIKEISAKMGFANMSHFGSYVRKHLGMSPTEFRDQD